MDRRSVTVSLGKRPAASAQSPRLVRILVTDFDATDSSSDDESDIGNRNRLIRPRVVKRITEIKIGTPDPAKSNSNLEGILKSSSTDVKFEEEDPVQMVEKKFRGVRQRKWGRWAAEIRDPAKKARVWLGTYNTAEEAAVVYDTAAIRLRGPNAVTNFAHPPPPPISVNFPATGSFLSGIEKEEESQSQSSCRLLCSPTSVLRFSLPDEIEEKSDSMDLATEGEDENLMLDSWSLENDAILESKAEIDYDGTTSFYLDSRSQYGVVLDDFSDISADLDAQFGMA